MEPAGLSNIGAAALARRLTYLVLSTPKRGHRCYGQKRKNNSLRRVLRCFIPLTSQVRGRGHQQLNLGFCISRESTCEQVLGLQ